MKKVSLIAVAVLACISQSVPEQSQAATIALTPVVSNSTGLLTARDRCNAPAALDGPAHVDVPDVAQYEVGITDVRIDLKATGALASESVFSSSGNWWLDRAALESAKMARFTPERVNCNAIAGSYLYEVDF